MLLLNPASVGTEMREADVKLTEKLGELAGQLEARPYLIGYVHALAATLALEHQSHGRADLADEWEQIAENLRELTERSLGDARALGRAGRAVRMALVLFANAPQAGAPTPHVRSRPN